MQKIYTKIESIVGNVVTVRAEGVRSGDLALVAIAMPTSSSWTRIWFHCRSLPAPRASAQRIPSVFLADL